MNREIKFRGKRVDNGEWVYGNLFNYSYRNEIKTMIQSGEYAVKNGSIYANEVHPETVGQFTGFDHKKDFEIYRGDLIHVTTYYATTGIYEVVWFFSGWGLEMVEDKDVKVSIEWLKNFHVKDYKITGNIHDKK